MKNHEQKNLELLSPTLLKHKKRKKLNAKKYQLITNNEMGFETCMKYDQELNFFYLF